jgi:Zn-dependent protease with chaperone function
VGYLAHILLALLAIGLTESGARIDYEQPAFVVLLAFVPYAFAALAARLFVRGRFRLAMLVYRSLALSAPLMFFAACALFGWQKSVEQWSGAHTSIVDWPGPSLLPLILPFVVYELTTIDARARAVASGKEYRAWRTFQTRMFLSGLVPMGVYIGIASIVGLSERARVSIEEIALFNALFATVLLVVIGMFLPFMLKNTWETVPLAAGAQRDALLGVARQAGFANPRLYVWKTGHQLANAAIVGVTARSRVVLFSDSLLAQMDTRELSAVFAHEMGHAFRHHVPIFVMWVGVFFLAGDLAAQALFPDDALLAGLTLLVAMGVWFVSFGFLSRRFELDADLYSLDLLGETRSLIAALERVGGRLRDVASWRHFSTAERVRFLERAESDPAVGRKLRRGLHAWTWLALLAFLLCAGLHVRALLQQLPEGRARVALRLGNYAEADRCIGRMTNPDPLLVKLTQRALSLGEDHTPVERLAARALVSLAARDLDATREWLALGALRCAHPFQALTELAVQDPVDLDALERELRRAALELDASS